MSKLTMTIPIKPPYLPPGPPGYELAEPTPGTDGGEAPDTDKSRAFSTPKNDGGSASYYELPENPRELQDLIEYKNMNFAVGNIFKACYRYGDDTHSDKRREMRKVLWFAERELRRLD